jgi:hypothetical protein
MKTEEEIKKRIERNKFMAQRVEQGVFEHMPEIAGKCWEEKAKELEWALGYEVKVREVTWRRKSDD